METVLTNCIQDYFSQGIMPPQSSILQVYATRECPQNQDRYRACLSDGLHYYSNFLIRKRSTNDPILEDNTLIRIQSSPRNRSLITPGQPHIIILCDFVIILPADQTSGRLGHPTKAVFH
jgi:hypothetical protein